MASPPEVKLGPLTSQIAADARWLPQDEFPSRQNWADDVERLLEFLVTQGQFDALLPRLRDMNAEHRDATLAEIRVAKCLVDSGFEIIEWEPTTVPGRPGDLSVRLAAEDGAPPIFVEVKAPGWAGELTKRMGTLPKAERTKIIERVKRKKYINTEARFVDPASAVTDVIMRNAVPKLAPDRPNLVAVVDDLFLSPLESPVGVSRISEALVDQRLQTVGGVFLFRIDSFSGNLISRAAFIPNTGCLAACEIPDAAARRLEAVASSFQEEYEKMKTEFEAGVEALKRSIETSSRGEATNG
jgi:hypothetical protein